MATNIDQEIARIRFYMRENVREAFQALPPHNIRYARPKAHIDRLIYLIRSSNAPLKEKIAALEEVNGG